MSYGIIYIESYQTFLHKSLFQYTNWLLKDWINRLEDVSQIIGLNTDKTIDLGKTTLYLSF